MTNEPTQHDRTILRELARQIQEIAAHPVQQERKERWARVNRLEQGQIPVLVAPNALYWNELVGEADLRTVDPRAREVEHEMRLAIWHWENIDDDRVTEDVVEYATAARYVKLIQPRRVQPDGAGLGAYHVEPVIVAEDDIDKVIVEADPGIDWDATEENRLWTERVFDGILRPVRTSAWVSMGVFDHVCEIRGMDQVFMDMFERPEWLEELIRRIWDAHHLLMTRFEAQGGLALNNAFQRAYNGGQAYCDELPGADFDGEHVKLSDLWGFTLAQSSVSISPEMHERFITQFDREYHARLGLTGIACCETVDRKMDLYRTIPNLRRISISAWNDYALAAEGIGADYVYSIKPEAVSIAQPTWDVAADVRAIESILDQSEGCCREIIHYEIATCNGHPERLGEWARAMRKVVEGR